MPLESISYWVKAPILASCSQSVSICVYPWLNCIFQDERTGIIALEAGDIVDIVP
jgi:hypothetical protein